MQESEKIQWYIEKKKRKYPRKHKNAREKRRRVRQRGEIWDRNDARAEARKKGVVGGERVESFTGDYYGRIAKRCAATRTRSTVEYIIFLNHGYTRSGVVYRNTHTYARLYVFISCTSCIRTQSHQDASYIARWYMSCAQHACTRDHSPARNMHARRLQVLDYTIASRTGRPRQVWSSSPTWRLMK